jgi:hypothetical protein
MLIERDGYALRFNDFNPEIKEEKNEPLIYKDENAVEKAWSIISIVSIICLACAYGLDSLYGDEL